jgi:hypothetical protein
MSSGLLIIEEKDDAAEFDDLDDVNVSARVGARVRC